MYKSLVAVVPIAVLLFSGAWAQEVDPSQEIADKWAADEEIRAERQERLDDLMVTVAQEMAEIRSTTNNKERASLMMVHRENMREAMGLMRSMGGVHMRKVLSQHLGSGMAPGMMPGKKAGMRAGMGSGMGSDASGHAHEGMSSSLPHDEMTNDQRITDLENRLDMMHVMMESMMEVGE